MDGVCAKVFQIPHSVKMMAKQSKFVEINTGTKYDCYQITISIYQLF